MIFFLLLLFGIFTGIVAGLFGIGGGLLFTPILYFLFDLNGVANPVVWSVGTALFCTFVASASSSYQQFSQQNGYLHEGLMMGLGGSAGVFAGKWVTTSEFYSREVFTLFFFGLIVFVIGMFLLQRRRKQGAEGMPDETTSEKFEVAEADAKAGAESGAETMGLSANSILDGPPLSWSQAVPAGGFGGVIAALAGVGGGVVMVPVMTLLYRMPMVKSVSVSSLAVMLISLSGWLQYALLPELGGVPLSEVGATVYHLGYVDFGVGLPLMMGAFAGGFAGARTSVLIREKVQVFGFVGLMLVVGVLLLIRTFGS